MAVSSNIILLGLANNSLRQLNLRQPDAIATITLSTKKSPSELSIYKVFLDPTGKHSIISTEQGDNFYCYDGWPKARLLAKWKMVMESVAWSSSKASATAKTPSTREILVGARNGTIYETVLDAHDDFFKSQDRYLHALFTFTDKQKVTGMTFETFNSPDNSIKTRRGAVILTTPSRIYQFTGPADKKGDDNGKLFESLFEPYRSNAPSTSTQDRIALRYALRTDTMCTQLLLRFLVPRHIRSCIPTPLLRTSGMSYLLPDRWLGLLVSARFLCMSVLRRGLTVSLSTASQGPASTEAQYHSPLRPPSR